MDEPSVGPAVTLPGDFQVEASGRENAGMALLAVDWATIASPATAVGTLREHEAAVQRRAEEDTDQ